MKLHFDKKWSSCLRVKLWHINDEHYHIWHVSPFSMRKKELVATGKIFHAHVSLFVPQARIQKLWKSSNMSMDVSNEIEKKCTSVFIYDLIILCYNWYHICVFGGWAVHKYMLIHVILRFLNSPQSMNMSMKIKMKGHRGSLPHNNIMSYRFIHEVLKW